MSDAIDRVAGAGGDVRRPPEEWLAGLVAACEEVRADVEASALVSRAQAEAVRFCDWAGQSADGRKWARNQEDQQEPEPFEGACDARVRLAELVIQERKFQKVVSASAGNLRVRALGPDDDRRAGRWAAALRWLMRNRWGARYILELERLADWVEGDSPAGAVLGVYWRRELGLRYEEVDLAGVLDRFVEYAGARAAAEGEGAESLEQRIPVEGAMLEAAVLDVAREDEAVEWIREFWPYLTVTGARRVVGELRGTGRTRFPLPFVARDEPELVAHRLNEDVFVPQYARDLQSAPVYFVVEWLTGPRVRERVVTDGWDAGWVDRLLTGEDGRGEGQKGVAALPCYRWDRRVGRAAAVEHPHEWQVVHAFFRASNEDGVPGVYEAVFHPGVVGSAFGRRLCEYPHGGYPGVLVVREAISARAQDARGIAELTMAEQGLLKLAHETVGNVSQFALPPIFKKEMPAGRLKIRPLEQISGRRYSELGFMAPPSATGLGHLNNWIQGMEGQVDQFWGRPTGVTPPAVAVLHAKHDVLLWLEQLREALRLVVAYCQKWLPAEALALITDEAGRQVFDGLEDPARGEFDVEIEFEPRELDIAYVREEVALLIQVLNSLDTRQTGNRDAVVRRIMHAINPALALSAVEEPERADEREREDERLNWAKMATGVPVEPRESGQNFALRLDALREIIEGNPAAFEGLAADRQEAVRERVKHLEFMVQQVRNAQTGKVGV